MKKSYGKSSFCLTDAGLFAAVRVAGVDLDLAVSLFADLTDVWIASVTLTYLVSVL